MTNAPRSALERTASVPVETVPQRATVELATGAQVPEEPALTPEVGPPDRDTIFRLREAKKRATRR